MQMSITGLIVTILIIILGIVDLVLVLLNSERGSVSNWLIRAGLQRPFVATAFGFVLGHLFGTMYPEHCAPPSANILAPNFWMLAWATTAAAYFFLWRSTNSSDK